MWVDEVADVTGTSLGDLSSRAIEEVRSLRDDCRRVEDKVSYLRRLVQGRLDIVEAELRRRSDGGPPTDLRDLVEKLPGILSDRSRPAGPGRLPASLAPPDDDGLTVELDSVAPAGTMAALGDLTDEALAALAGRLADIERSVSAARRSLFERIDSLQAELARRYKSGEATVGSVLG